MGLPFWIHWEGDSLAQSKQTREKVWGILLVRAWHVQRPWGRWVQNKVVWQLQMTDLGKVEGGWGEREGGEGGSGSSWLQ